MNSSIKTCPFCKNQIPSDKEKCPICKIVLIERFHTDNVEAMSIQSNSAKQELKSISELNPNKEKKIKTGYEIVKYKLGHFSRRENFGFDVFRGSLSYDNEYIVSPLISLRPVSGIKKEKVICHVCKNKITIRIASIALSKIINRLYKILSLLTLSTTVYLTIETTFEHWLLIVPVGAIISFLLFIKDYGNPKVLSALGGHKIFN